MLKTVVFPLVRHIVGAVGAALGTYGVIESSQVEAFSGALVTIFMVAWSIIEKKAASS